MEVIVGNLPKKAIIYCRVSSEKQSQANKTGLPVQNQECRKFIQEHGLKFKETCEEDSSAYKNRSSKLRTLIRQNRNSTLVIYSVDRFSRNFEDGLEIARLAQKYNVTICFVADQFVLNEHTFDLFRNKLQEAEDFSRQLGERVKKGLQLKRARGFFTGGPVPYGYTTKQETEGKKLVENVDEQVVLTFIGYCLGKRGRAITTKTLNDLMGDIVGQRRIREDPIQCYDENGFPIARMKNFLSAQEIADILNSFNVRKGANTWTSASVKTAWNRHEKISNSENALVDMMEDMEVVKTSNKRSRRTNKLPVISEGVFDFGSASDLPNVPFFAVPNPNYKPDDKGKEELYESDYIPEDMDTDSDEIESDSW